MQRTLFKIPPGHIVERGRSVATRQMRGQYEMEQNPTRQCLRGLKGTTVANFDYIGFRIYRPQWDKVEIDLKSEMTLFPKYYIV